MAGKTVARKSGAFYETSTSLNIDDFLTIDKTMSNLGTKHIFSSHYNFADVEHASSAIANWDVEFFQLTKGSLGTGLSIIAHDNFTIQRVSFDKPVHQQGASPDGTFTFGFMQPNTPVIEWGGQQGNAKDLMLFSPQGWDVISPAGFVGHTLSFTGSVIDNVACSLGDESISLKNLPTSASLLSNKAVVVSALCQQVRQIFREVEAGNSLPDSNEFLHFLNFELPAQLIASTRIYNIKDKKIKPHNRERVRKRCLDIIMMTDTKALTVQQLCLQAGTSLSTIERVFKHYFGMGPKQYINIIRLHRLHHSLRWAHPTENIKNIASQFGFWHMGQLGQDYFRLFGSLPSKTLSTSPLRL